MSANEVSVVLDAYLAGKFGQGPQSPELVNLLSDAFLAGYDAGLHRGAEIADSAMNTALEAMREHYPEVTENALRNYLAHGEPDAPEPDGIHTSAHEPTDAERDAERLAAQNDPRGERDR